MLTPVPSIKLDYVSVGGDEQMVLSLESASVSQLTDLSQDSIRALPFPEDIQRAFKLYM